MQFIHFPIAQSVLLPYSRSIPNAVLLNHVDGGFVQGHYTTKVPWQYSFVDTAAGHGNWIAG